MKRPSLKFVLAGLAALALPLGFAGTAAGDDPLVVTGLKAPRGLTSIGSQVLIAEQGAGQILRVSDVGTKTVLVKGLPSVIADSPEGPLETGVTAVIQVGSTYYFTTGEAGPNDKGFDSLYSVQEGGKPVLITDLKVFEAANNPDGNIDRATGKPEIVVNPYDLVWDGKSGIFVSASGSNTIFHVSLDGTVKPYAVFPNLPNPMFPRLGGPTMNPVPTGMVKGPDGALYVGTLTGFPFPQGAASVYRVEDKNNDGDAIDAGETTVYAKGLSTVTDIAFDRDGSLLVAQFSLDMLTQAPGNVVRVKGGETSVVAAPLVSPTGLTVMNDGQIVVAMEFLGIVAEVNAAANIVKSAGPPPSAGGPETPGTIRPPSTGDAGLVNETAGTSLLLIAAIALMTTGSAAAVATVRARR